MSKPIRILGIDPGSRITGFGVIDWHGREPVYVASGCIKTLPNDELAGRIGMIVRGIGDLVAEYRPNQAAVEQVFVNVNPAATLMLGQARGAAVAALVLRDLPVYEYTALRQKYPNGTGVYYTNGAASQNTHYHESRPVQHAILPK